ncbi:MULTISPECIES: hypothetical protein [unclassified Sinorhizobium]|uniref:hypothetical protein n=1 Tax=unclassified Sinorhizobium TaxID=2613772 RepID=UPI003525CBB8
MVLRLSKAVALVLSPLIAFPAMADDFRGGHRPLRHHGGIQRHHSISLFDRRHDFRPSRITRFADGTVLRFGRHDRFQRPRHLPRMASANSYSSGVRTGTVFVVNPSYGSDLGGSYAGSGYAFTADGGTYVVADGYFSYPGTARQNLAPKAKVIDVSRHRNPCSYEAGVCVIRP